MINDQNTRIRPRERSSQRDKRGNPRKQQHGLDHVGENGETKRLRQHEGRHNESGQRTHDRRQPDFGTDVQDTLSGDILAR